MCVYAHQSMCFGFVTVCVCMCMCACVCVCGRNELDVCTMLVRTVSVLYTSTRTLKPFEDSELMG